MINMIKLFEKWLKQFLLFIIKIIVPATSKRGDVYQWQDFDNILVFRLDDRLGNSLLVLSLVQSIKRSLPHSHIDLMMTVNYILLYRNHPDIHKVIAYDQKHLFRNPFRFITLISRLRKNNYDVVFSSSNPDTLSVSQAIFCRLVSKGRSIGFDWKESALIYSDVVKGDTALNYAQAQVDLWRYFDHQAIYDPPKIYFIENLILKPEKDILIWLGATGNKILSETMVSGLLEIVDELDLMYTLAAGPHDENVIKRYSADLQKQIRIQRLDLEGISKFFKTFKLICMPDTGPMHLVAALNIPLIQVFVDSNTKQYGYSGENKLIIDRILEKESATKFIKKFVT